MLAGVRLMEGQCQGRRQKAREYAGMRKEPWPLPTSTRVAQSWGLFPRISDACPRVLPSPCWEEVVRESPATADLTSSVPPPFSFSFRTTFRPTRGLPALLLQPRHSLTCAQKSSVSSDGRCGSRGSKASPERVTTTGFTPSRASMSLAWLQGTQWTWAGVGCSGRALSRVETGAR